MKKFLLVSFSFVFVLSSVWAQDRVISGKVTSAEDGSTLPGVNVVVKGTTNGTVTDSGGSYKLTVSGSGGTLVFSFIGLQTQELAIGDRSVANIALTQDVTQLSEIIVTALGVKVDKDKFASSVSTVQGGNVARSGETGLLQGLSGKAAGVQITKSGGDPGAGAYIQIRGQNTINGNAQPLFIIDGVPISNSNEYGLTGAANSINAQSRANDINPDDIASMEVLKGASAAALWGTRAANGVIIITTKKGKDTNGKVNIEFKSTMSFDKVNKIHDLQTTYGGGTNGHYRQGNRETWGDKIADRTGGPDSFITDPAALGYNGFVTFPDGTKRYAIATGTGTSLSGTGAAAHGGKNSKDVYDHRYDAFQTGHFIDNNIQISGGNARTTFMVSYSNLNQQGVVKSFSDYKRNSARVNVSSQFTDWFRASANVAYVNSFSTRSQGGDNVDGLLLGGLRTSPDFDNSYYTGDYTTTTGLVQPDRHVSFRNPLGKNFGPSYSNPLWNIHNNKNTTNVDRTIGNLELALDPTEWLNITGRAGIDNFTDHQNETFPQKSASYNTGYMQRNITTESQFNADLFARASKSFGENEKFSANLLVGVNFNDRKRETVHTQITDFIIPNAPDLLTNALNSNLQAYNYRNQIRTYAYYASLDLAAADQLFLTLTARRESASTFANSFFFPSAALAWQFTKLDALKDNNLLSFGKLRLSYGQVGIQPQPYLNLTQFNPTFYGDSYAYGLAAVSGVYGGGYTRSTLQGNPDLKPERKTEVEIGTDLRFFNDRLNFSATAYSNQTTDVILTLSVPYETGFASKNINAAEIHNKGLELELGYDVLNKGNLRWNISGNWAANRNIVYSLAGSAAQGVPGNGAYGGQSLIEGQPFGVFYGTDFQKEADGKYKLDANGFPLDGIENEVIGNPNPKWRAGIGNKFEFKGISLYFLFDQVYGNDYWNGTRGALYTFGTHADNGITSTAPSALKTYDGQTVPAGSEFRGQIKDFGGGPVALTQAWYKGPGTSFNQASAKQFVENGGSTRLREITIAYRVAGSGFRKASKLSSIDFSLTGRNAFLWTKYRGVDPETNISGASLARGSDWFTNPNTKSILFSIKISY